MRVDVSPWQVGCSSSARFCPWNGTGSASLGMGYHSLSVGPSIVRTPSQFEGGQREACTSGRTGFPNVSLGRRWMWAS